MATTPHGRHHWYRLANDLSVPRSIRGLGDGIDVLGDNGYAIAPPSRITSCTKPHASSDRCTDRYLCTGSTRRLEPLPPWVPERLAERRATELASNARPREPSDVRHDVGGDGSIRHPRSYAFAALRGEADRVATARPGARNDALNYAAWRLAPHIDTGAIDELEVRHALAHAAHRCELAEDDGARALNVTIHCSPQPRTASLRTKKAPFGFVDI